MTPAFQDNLLAPAAFRSDLVRWRQLVTPAWLAALLAQDEVLAAPAGDWRLFEVGMGGDEAFLSGHIPGAGYIATHQLEVEPLWNKVSDQALLALLLGHGIRHDTTVVLYGRNSLTAARAAHLMLYAGVSDVRLLDGGLAAWTGAGLALKQCPPVQHPAASDFGAHFPLHPEYLIDMRQAQALLRQPDGVLASFAGCGASRAFTPTSRRRFTAARAGAPRWRFFKLCPNLDFIHLRRLFETQTRLVRSMDDYHSATRGSSCQHYQPALQS